MKQFKYTSDFNSFAKVIHPEEDSINLALASIDSLKSLLPQGIDFNNNPDVVFNSFNAAVAGRANRNDDVIDNISALAIYKNFIHKFCDVEHRRDIIVGSIINAGFSSFGDNVILTEEDVRNSTDPVNICLAAVVWRILNEDFASKLVESADETSILYHSISTSWELGFDDYQIVLGHKDLSQGELITDEKQIKEFSRFLRANRGEGKTKDNVPVYRKIVGDMYPLAIGYVKNPAAEVKGVLVVDESPMPEVKAEDIESITINSSEVINKDNLITMLASDHFTDKCSCGEVISTCRCSGPDKKINVIEAGCKKCKDLSNSEKNEEKNKNISLSNKNSVNTVTNLTNTKNLQNKYMKLQLKDITKEVLETVAAADVYEIAKELDKKMTQFANELEVKENEAKTASDKFTELQSKHDLVAAELEQVKTQLTQLNEVRAQEQIQNDFNTRMSDLNEQFELDEVKSSSIAKQIRGLNADQFTAWLEDHKPFLAAKKAPPFVKEGEEEDEEEDEDMKESKCKKKESCASVTLLEEIQNLKSSDPKLVNQPATTSSIDDLVNKAFGKILEDNK